MNRNVHILFMALVACISAAASAQSNITSISMDTNTVSLQWETFGSNWIVEARSSLTTGDWQYVGQVVATNENAISNLVGDIQFYRIRKVRVIDIPDPFLAPVVRGAVVAKQYPTNVLYDIDVEGIVSLDASSVGVVTLQGIGELVDLNVLNCFDNNMENADLSKNVALTEFYCNYGSLSNLNITANINLTKVDCSTNNLRTLDVSANTNLTYLNCANNRLSNLDVSKNVNLTHLYCFYMNSPTLTNLDVSVNTNLTHLHCGHNDLTTLDVSANTKLTELNCDGGDYFTNLVVSANTELTLLSFRWSNLESIDVSSNTNLARLYCDDNWLTTLDVSTNTELTELDCSGNNLVNTLDLSANIALTYVDARFNSLTEIVVWDTNNLPATFLYDGGVIIRE